MVKTFIIVLFLGCFGFSIWIFLERDTSSLRENIEKAPSHLKPRVIMDDFHLRRYEGQLQHSSLTAAHGAFLAPNKVELSGSIEGWKLSNEKKQVVRAYEATAYFQSDNLEELMKQAELERATLSGFVEIDYSDHLLQTEEAEYTTRDEKIAGTQFVRVDGPNRWFTGKEGFRLFLKEEVLDVYGKVRGMHKPND
ncbi:MAG: LPS export ABC transporter periplasmic protein LptC [Oligoflexales bacterium]